MVGSWVRGDRGEKVMMEGWLSGAAELVHTLVTRSLLRTETARRGFILSAVPFATLFFVLTGFRHFTESTWPKINPMEFYQLVIFTSLNGSRLECTPAARLHDTSIIIGQPDGHLVDTSATQKFSQENVASQSNVHSGISISDIHLSYSNSSQHLLVQTTTYIFNKSRKTGCAYNGRMQSIRVNIMVAFWWWTHFMNNSDNYLWKSFTYVLYRPPSFALLN